MKAPGYVTRWKARAPILARMAAQDTVEVSRKIICTGPGGSYLENIGDHIHAPWASSIAASTHAHSKDIGSEVSGEVRARLGAHLGVYIRGTGLAQNFMGGELPY
jgi:hypothetical protein